MATTCKIIWWTPNSLEIWHDSYIRIALNGFVYLDPIVLLSPKRVDGEYYLEFVTYLGATDQDTTLRVYTLATVYM